MPETETFYIARETATGHLWCETRDPEDPYLLPSRPDQQLTYTKLTLTYITHTEMTTFQPSPALLQKGHPSTWDDD